MSREFERGRQRALDELKEQTLRMLESIDYTDFLERTAEALHGVFLLAEVEGAAIGGGIVDDPWYHASFLA